MAEKNVTGTPVPMKNRFSEYDQTTNSFADSPSAGNRFAEYDEAPEQVNDRINQQMAERQKRADRGFFDNTTRLAGERATDLAGGFVDAISIADTATPQGMRPPMMGMPGMPRQRTQEQMERERVAGHKVAERLRDIDLGADEGRHTLAGAGKKYEKGDYLGSFTELFLAGNETVLSSLPDMVGSAALPITPVYVMARNNELATENAKNKGMERPGSKEMTATLPFAIGATLLERVLPSRLLRGTDGITKEAAKEISDKAVRHAMKKTASGAGQAAAIEGFTEFVQEGILEYVAERIGTETAMDLREMLARGGEAALLGAIGGGTLGAGRGAYDGTREVLSARRLQQRATPEAVEAELDGDIDVDAELAELMGELDDAASRDERQNASILNTDNFDLTDYDVGLTPVDNPVPGEAVYWMPEGGEQTLARFEGIAGEMDGEQIASVIVNGRRELAPMSNLFSGEYQQTPATGFGGPAQAFLPGDDGASAASESLLLQERIAMNQVLESETAVPVRPEIDPAEQAELYPADPSVPRPGPSAERVDAGSVPDSRMTRPEYRERLDDLAKAKLPVTSSKEVNPQVDDILAAIAKSGGLSIDEARAQGIDPAHFKDRVGSNNPFRKDGMSFDAMAENLSQYGYSSENYSANELLDQLSSALSGNAVYSNQADMEALQALGSLRLEDGMSPAEAQNAIRKALNGEKLGVRQLRAVGAALDSITGERGSYARELRALRENAREDRRRAYEEWLEATNVPVDAQFEATAWPESPGEVYNEPDYLPHLEMEARSLAELTDTADALGVDWTAIDNALDSGDISSQTQALTQLIWDAQNEHRQARKPESAKATDAPSESGSRQRASGSLEETPTDQARRDQADSPPAELTLSTQTEQDLSDRARAQQDAERAESESRQKEEQRADADRERDDFVLAGSNAEADQAAARGQGDLLAQARAPATQRDDIAGRQDQSAQKDIPLKEGDRFATVSGRTTSPFPRTNYKRESLNQQKMREWLKAEAIAEAESRGDDFNRLQFEALDIKNWSPADGDSVNLYLFDDPEGRIGSRKVQADQGGRGSVNAEETAPRQLQQHIKANTEAGPTEKWRSKTRRHDERGPAERTIDKGFYQVDYHKGEYDPADGYLTAVDKETGEVLGEVFFSEIDGIFGATVEVRPDMRRKGIASALYDTAESIKGRKLTKSPRHSPDAAAFWAAREKASIPTDTEISAQTELSPSDAQIEAGNYKKAKINVQGLEISIENPRGSKRSGVDADGTAWSVDMKNHYGYIRRTEGADGDHVDVFIGPNPASEKVFVVDQVNPDGTFDEHKVLVGFDSRLKARSGYKANYSKDWKVGPITSMSMDEFKQWLKDGDTKKPLNAELAAKESKPDQESKSNRASEQPVAPIEDFGEKLGGARKDELRTVRERLESMDDEQIASSTLSKIFPKSEIEKVENKKAAAIYQVARDLIPAKPRNSYRLKRWVDTVRQARELIGLVEEVGPDALLDHIAKAGIPKAKDIVRRIEVLNGVDRGHWGRVGAVTQVSGQYSKGDEMVSGAWVTVEIDGRMVAFYGHDTIQSALPEIRQRLDDKRAAGKKLKFAVYQDLRAGEYFIAQDSDKEKRRLKTFDSPNEARAYIRDNHDDLVAAWDAVKSRDNVTRADMRRSVNAERTGTDYRDGKDVTPEQFLDTFGFRGVEFGNWVKQGKGAKDRQSLLNDAYDAFMDLAEVLNLPPKALSLEGRLGIGMGSRGRGGKNAAHFEPGSIVINLTKTKGAGSLAHEWFHALDNYFARKRGEPVYRGDDDAYRREAFVTYLPEPMMVRKDTVGAAYPIRMPRGMLEQRRERSGSADFAEDRWMPDPDHKQGIRPEVERSFAELVKTLDESPMSGRAKVIDKGKVDGYWSQIIERAARSFENYVIVRMADRGHRNDFLANVVSADEFERNPERYPYLKDDEVTPVVQAFDNLFETLETKETGSGVAIMEGGALYSPYGRKTTNIREPEGGETEAAQWDLFAPRNISKEESRRQAEDNFNIRYEQVETRTIPIGLDHVITPSDAAHVLAPLRKHAQEAFMVVLTDENNKILSVIHHTKGLKDSSSVSPVEVVGAIAATKGAKNVWFGHNHPSGSTSPSQADYRITERLVQAMDGLDVNFRGHVIISGDKEATYFKETYEELMVPITPAARRKSASVTERMLRKRRKQDVPAVTSPAVAMQLVVREVGSDNALILLSTSNHFLGSVTMSADEMRTLRSGGRVRRILEAIDATNASAAIIKTSEKDKDAAINISRFINNLGDIRLLDWISKNDKGNWVSDAELGGRVTSSDGPFFSVSKNSKRARRAPISAKLAQRVVDRIKAAAAASRADIRLVDSYQDLPDAIKRSAESQGYDSSRVRGAFYRGNIYLNREALTSEAEVEQTIFHELYGHYGISRLFGSAAKQAMGKLYLRVGGIKGVRDLARKHGVDLEAYVEGHGKAVDAGQIDRETAQAILAEELLAHIAQDSKPGVVRALKEFVGAFLDWLRKNGFLEMSKVTDSEIMNLLRQARQAVNEGRVTGSGGLIFDLLPAQGVEAMPGFSVSAKTSGPGPTVGVLRAIAKDGEAFRTPASGKKDFQDILEDVVNSHLEPGQSKLSAERKDAIPVPKDNRAAPGYIVYDQDFNKLMTVFDADSAQPFVEIGNSNVSLGRNLGSLYQVLAGWAHNNGKTIRPDPRGLTRINMQRRSEQMISAMLKYNNAGIFGADPTQFAGLLGEKDYKKFNEYGKESVANELNALKSKYWGTDTETKTSNDLTNARINNLSLAAAALAKRRSPEVFNNAIIDSKGNVRDKNTNGQVDILNGGSGKRSAAQSQSYLSGVGYSVRQRSLLALQSAFGSKVPELVDESSLRRAGGLQNIKQGNVVGLHPRALVSYPGQDALAQEKAVALLHIADSEPRQQGGVFDSGDATNSPDMSDNARISRAKAMGFDVDRVWYHGTDQEFERFDPSKKGGFSSGDTDGTISLTPWEDVARRYAVGDATKSGSKYSKSVYDEELGMTVSETVNPRVMELYVRGPIKEVDAGGRSHNSSWQVAEQRKAKEEGYAGVQFVNLVDDTFYNPLGGHADTLQVFDPDNIRSTSDPFLPRPSAGVSRSGADQTQTPEFKRWFGDSKVVDAEGKPLVVYHGTNSDFSVFDDSAGGGVGFYFAQNKSEAERHAKGGRVVSAYLSIKNPAPASVVKREYDRAGGGNPRRVANERLRAQGYDGIIRGAEIIAFYPGQIKSATDNRGTFDPDTPDIRFSRTGPRNLFVAHNLSESNLEHVLELGGLAAPSLAVGRTDKGFEDFGEITLLAPSSIIESSKARTFDADVYTPRHPRAEYKIDRDAFLRQRDSLDNDLGLDHPDISDLESNGMEGMARSYAYRYAWLQSKGKAPKPKLKKVDPVIRQLGKLGLNRYELRNDPKALRLAKKYFQDAQKKFEEVAGRDEARRQNLYFDSDGNVDPSVMHDLALRVEQYQDSGGYDTAQMKHDLLKKMRSKLVQRQYEEWIKDRFNEVAEGARMFDGFTPSGNRRYKPYDLENVVKVMTRKLQGGEGFNYGAGSVRSAYAKEFKRISQVQASRDKIVSPEEMERIKEESNDRLMEVLSDLKPYYRFNADSWSYTDDASSAIAEGPKGWREAFDLDDEGRALIAEFTDYLKTLPTAYFETKVGRAVDLSEFAVAIVPKGTSKEAVQALRDKGLKVKRYDPADPDSRREEIARQEGLLFSRNGEFRRTPSQAAPNLTAIQAEAIADDLMTGWKGKPEVVVKDRINEFPQRLRAAIRKAGAEGDMRGVYFEGKVYILASRIPSRASLEEVVLHEVVGHYGLRKMMGPQLKPLLNRVYMDLGNSPMAEQIKRTYYPDGDFDARNTNHRLTVAEELLAHLAESGKHQHQRLWQRIVTAVRDGLRRLGFDLRMTETDLLNILRAAQQVVQDGGISRSSRAGVNFSRTDQTETEAFRRWFGDSKIVDENGDPLVVYHGTAADFDSFDPKRQFGGQLGDGFYFSPRASGANAFAAIRRRMDPDATPSIVPAYLSLQNPYTIGGRSNIPIMGLNKRVLSELGHDGVLLLDETGAIDEITVFEPNQIKSATGNRGTFDPDNADIRFSIDSTDGQAGAEAEASQPGSFATPLADQSRAKQLVDTALRVVVDKMRPLLNTQKEIEKFSGKAIREDLDALLAEELFHGKTENDLRKLKEKYIEPLAELMAKHNISREELDLFLWAAHAPERNKQIAKINPKMPDGGSGMTTAKALEVLRKAEAEGRLPALRGAAKHVYGALKHQRELMKGALLEEGVVDAWEGVYKFYVPLKGLAQNEGGGNVPRIGKGYDIRGKESFRALGRSTMPESPVLHAIRDTTEAIIRYRKNEVGNVLLDLIDEYPNPDYWEVFDASSPEFERRLLKAGGKETVGSARVIDKSRYFITKKNGKEYYIKLADEKLMRAMKNMGPEQMNKFFQGLAKVSRYLSAVNTSVNPEFIISNFARDIQTAVYNAVAEQDLHDGKIKGERIVGKMVKDTPAAIRAIYASLRGEGLKGEGAVWQAAFDQFRENGAKTGWYDMKDLDGQARDLETLILSHKEGAKGAALRTGRKVMSFVDDLNTAVENGVRLSVYKNAVDAGVSQKKAASLAKNLTVNFNRKGEAGQVMNALWMFTNAAIQGNKQFFRAMATRRINPDGTKSLNKAQKAAIVLAGAAYGLGALNRWGAGEDDDGENFYDKVEPHIRERNIIIMKSLAGGTPGDYWSWPLPYGYNIFHVIGTEIERVVNNPKNIGSAAAEIVRAGYGSFFPVGISESQNETPSILRTATPSAIQPLADVGFNENFFGGSIFRENGQYGTPRPDSHLSRRSTPEAWKWLSEFMNEATGGSEYRSGFVDVNPDKLDYIFKYYTGGAGAFVSRTQDAVVKKAQGIELETREIPFVRRLSGKVSPYKSQTDFYNRKTEAEQLDKEWRSLRGKERVDFYKKHGKKIRLIALSKSVSKELADHRKRRDRIEENKNLSPREMDERLKRLEARMKKTADRFNRAWPDD